MTFPTVYINNIMCWTIQTKHWDYHSWKHFKMLYQKHFLVVVKASMFVTNLKQYIRGPVSTKTVRSTVGKYTEVIVYYMNYQQSIKCCCFMILWQNDKLVWILSFAPISHQIISNCLCEWLQVQVVFYIIQ